MIVTPRAPHETNRDYASRVIKENIILLELKPGSMVSEKELADELGISRGPVREALLDLSKVKIVEIYPQRGSGISLVDYELIEEACFMRETLELAVIERCCQYGLSPQNLDTLEENILSQQFHVGSANREKLFVLDNAFHRQLFRSARVSQIHELMSSMLIHFDRVRAMSLFAVNEIKFVDDHERLLQLIKDRDIEAAKGLMHRHLTRYQIDKDAIEKRYPEFIKRG